MERDHGYYWVKERDNWHIALWNEFFEKWYICMDEDGYNDNDFEEIGDKIELNN